MILVISHPDDPHAERVISCLCEDQHEVTLLNISDLPDRATISVDYVDRCHPNIEFCKVGEVPLNLGQVQSVWWRRPQIPELSSITDIDAHLFASSEWHEAINGLWQLIDARWMNQPINDEIASHKLFQLKIAAEVGLETPKTLVTSDPDRARTFIRSCGNGHTIFKTFLATHAIWRETRLVREEELAVLEQVRLAPVIFQEHIPADVDLRVTVIGDRFFPAAIYSQSTDYLVDFRMSLGQTKTVPTDLPSDVTTKLLALMNRLGLIYGAIDMRRTPQGNYVFLEINTAGEFLFIEERTGQPISRAISEWLATPSGH